jgi:hypothetical protein
MKRYESTPVKFDKSGVRVYSTTYYPDIKLSDSDIFIYPQEGQRLDTLAYKYYGDVSLWWIIAKANGVKGKVALSSDNPIRIPSNTAGILQEFDNLNNRE